MKTGSSVARNEAKIVSAATASNEHCFLITVIVAAERGGQSLEVVEAIAACPGTKKRE